MMIVEVSPRKNFYKRFEFSKLDKARQGTPEEIIFDNVSKFKLTKSTVDIAWEKTIRDPVVQSYEKKKKIE